VKHISLLVERFDLQDILHEFFTVCFLQESFENVGNENIVDFIKKHFYKQH